MQNSPLYQAVCNKINELGDAAILSGNIDRETGQIIKQYGYNNIEQFINTLVNFHQNNLTMPIVHEEVKKFMNGILAQHMKTMQPISQPNIQNRLSMFDNNNNNHLLNNNKQQLSSTPPIHNNTSSLFTNTNKTPIKQDNENNSKTIMRKMYSGDPDIKIINIVDTSHYRALEINDINSTKAIKEYQNTENKIFYTYYFCKYLIHEESPLRMIEIFKNVFKNVINSNKGKWFFRIQYPEEFIFKDTKFDVIKKDFDSIKQIYLTKGYKEAIANLNTKSFIFSSALKQMLLDDINNIIKRFLRTTNNLELMFKISPLEDVDDLKELDKLYKDKLIIDDFDGIVMNLINEVFNKYFGRDSFVVDFDKNPNHGLQNKNIIIRKNGISNRDFAITTDEKKKEIIINELKKYAIMLLSKELIFTNILPIELGNIFQSYGSYVFSKPKNSLETIISNELENNYSMIDIYFDKNPLVLEIGKTIENEMILIKKKNT